MVGRGADQAKHLVALSTAGLLHSERRGRDGRYGLVPERLHDATAWLDEVGRLWDRRLSALVEHFSPPDT